MGEDQGAACKPAGTARECVNSEECFPSASSMSTTRCCSLGLAQKKRERDVKCDITCQIYVVWSKQYAWQHAEPLCDRELLNSSVSMPSLLRLCLLEPELRWHFIYINNYWPESPPGLPPSNQTSNALKIAQHLLLIGNYKMHCYSCSLPLLILMEIMSIINRLNRLHVLIQRCVSFVNRFESFFFVNIKINSSVFLDERRSLHLPSDLNEHVWRWLAPLIASEQTWFAL